MSTFAPSAGLRVGGGGGGGVKKNQFYSRDVIYGRRLAMIRNITTCYTMIRTIKGNTVEPHLLWEVIAFAFAILIATDINPLGLQ